MGGHQGSTACLGVDTHRSPQLTKAILTLQSNTSGCPLSSAKAGEVALLPVALSPP